MTQHMKTIKDTNRAIIIYIDPFLASSRPYVWIGPATLKTINFRESRGSKTNPVVRKAYKCHQWQPVIFPEYKWVCSVRDTSLTGVLVDAEKHILKMCTKVLLR